MCAERMDIIQDCSVIFVGTAVCKMLEENADPLRPSDVNARDARVIQITSYFRRRLTPCQGGRLLKGISDIILWVRSPFHTDFLLCGLEIISTHDFQQTRQAMQYTAFHLANLQSSYGSLNWPNAHALKHLHTQNKLASWASHRPVTMHMSHYAINPFICWLSFSSCG